MKRTIASLLCIPVAAIGADFEIDYPTNSPSGTPVDACVGGYASPAPFWYPVAVDEGSGEIAPALVPDGDVMSSFAEVARIPNKRLRIALDPRAIEEGGSADVPPATWEQTGGAGVAALDGTLLRATGAPGLAYVRATDTNGVSRSLSVAFAAPQTGARIAWGLADATNTWRDAVDRFVYGKFAAIDTNANHVYRWCRDTVFGPSGSSTWTAPDALQLYLGTGSGAWDAHDPGRVNPVFFDAILADALRCFSTPRGDWYAHRPYVAIAPHYLLAVRHWSKKDGEGWTRFCTNRTAQSFQRVTFPKPKDERVLEVRDVTVHRTDQALPADICARFLRNRELAKLSPSYFQGGTFVTVTTHGTVAPLPLVGSSSEGAGEPAPWHAFAERHPFRFAYDPDGRLASLHHLVHMYESGHPCFLWAPNGRIALAGTWTYSASGPNAFFDEELIDAIKAAVEEDSGGAETIREWTKEDLQ